MLFDARTRKKLQEAGLDPETLREIADEVNAEAEATAADLEAFFEAHDTVYSDMELTHSSAEFPEHAVEYADLFTHSEDIRGWLRFDTWGVYVEGGRVLGDEVVELSLGPTVHDRVRFATDRAERGVGSAGGAARRPR